jgi:DNA-binding transcriptional regulator YdaS (Cro superfamily)
MKTTDEGLRRALEVAGNNKSELARRVGVSHAAVQKWVNVPVNQIANVRDATGIHPSILRPDLAELFR